MKNLSCAGQCKYRWRISGVDISPGCKANNYLCKIDIKVSLQPNKNRFLEADYRAQVLKEADYINTMKLFGKNC